MALERHLLRGYSSPVSRIVLIKVRCTESTCTGLMNTIGTCGAADQQVERDIKRFKAEPLSHEVEDGPEEVPEAHVIECPIPPCDERGEDDVVWLLAP